MAERLCACARAHTHTHVCVCVFTQPRMPLPTAGTHLPVVPAWRTRVLMEVLLASDVFTVRRRGRQGAPARRRATCSSAPQPPTPAAFACSPAAAPAAQPAQGMPAQSQGVSPWAVQAGAPPSSWPKVVAEGAQSPQRNTQTYAYNMWYVNVCTLANPPSLGSLDTGRCCRPQVCRAPFTLDTDGCCRPKAGGQLIHTSGLRQRPSHGFMSVEETSLTHVATARSQHAAACVLPAVSHASAGTPALP